MFKNRSQRHLLSKRDNRHCKSKKSLNWHKIGPNYVEICSGGPDTSSEYFEVFARTIFEIFEIASLEKIFEIVESKYLKMFGTISIWGNWKSSNQIQICLARQNQGTMQQDVLLHFCVSFFIKMRLKYEKCNVAVQL